MPGRIVTTASADVPLKGLLPLVEALAKVRVEVEHAHLVVVGKAKEDGVVAKAIERSGLAGAVRFVHGHLDAELVDLIRSAEVACVPSLYEGFSLPAVEAMACGTALVSTTGGAIPEVAGRRRRDHARGAARRPAGAGRGAGPAARGPGAARPAGRGGRRARC